MFSNYGVKSIVYFTDVGTTRSGVSGNVPVNMVQARPSDGFIAIGTHGSGRFNATIIDNQTPSINVRK